MDLPEEIEPAVRHGAAGVGLLRTEFLLTGRAVVPSETEQADYFRRVAQAFPGHPVVIRTFDLGGDKFPAAFEAPLEANPFLGWRSIRVCLDHPEIFRPQLRAVLRAAVGRDLRIMLPLITRVASALAWWLGEHLGAEIDLRPDPDQVPALAEERDQQWKRIGEAGFLTEAEKRAALGLPPIAEG